jgi:hypothetical protein
MPIFPNAFLIAGYLLLTGCAHGGERFTITARLLRPQHPKASPRLSVELHNVSGQPQRVVALTNLFAGKVCLRGTNGEIHEFVQTNYWNMMMTALWMTPTVEMASGASYRWEHSLSEFIDWHRLRTVREGNSYRIDVPVLAVEFQSGCEIWCAFDVRQWKKLDERRSTHETTATVVSAIVRYP